MEDVYRPYKRRSDSYLRQRTKYVNNWRRISCFIWTLFELKYKIKTLYIIWTQGESPDI